MRIVLGLALPLVLSACVSPAARIERRLVEVGVPRPEAECIGVRLAQRLSMAELRQLERIVGLNAARLSRMRVGDLARLLEGEGGQAGEDGALIAKVVRTGLACMV